jgi:hypothetical protein
LPDQEAVISKYVNRLRIDANDAVSGLEAAVSTVQTLPVLLERLRSTNDPEALEQIERILLGLGNLSTALDMTLGE